MNKFQQSLEWILNKLKAAGAVSLMGMTLLTCADVVGRYLGHPILGSIEIVGFLATLTAALSLPYTHKMKGHIGVDLFVQKFSHQTQRIIDIFTGIFSFLLFAVVTWRMAVYAYTIQKSGEVSMNLQLPEYIVIYIVAFSFLVFSLQILQDVIQNINTKRN